MEDLPDYPITRLPDNPITLKVPVASSYHKTEDFRLKRVINKRKRGLFVKSSEFV